jgi:hypothetical protein
MANPSFQPERNDWAAFVLTLRARNWFRTWAPPANRHLFIIRDLLFYYLQRKPCLPIWRIQCTAPAVRVAAAYSGKGIDPGRTIGTPVARHYRLAGTIVATIVVVTFPTRFGAEAIKFLLFASEFYT